MVEIYNKLWRLLSIRSMILKTLTAPIQSKSNSVKFPPLVNQVSHVDAVKSETVPIQKLLPPIPKIEISGHNFSPLETSIVY